jgi:hypothetical protein
MGIMAVPIMTKAGYNIPMSAGAITAGGTLGILVPPSVMLVVMGPVMGVSVAELYASCFGPGFLLAGIFTLLTQRRYDYPDAGASPFLYLIVGLVLALAVFGETYFQNERWARIAAIGVIVGSIAGVAFATLAPLPAPGYVVDPTTGQPTAALFPGYVRLLTPFMNVTGAFSLLLGALFSAYVFMPKRRVLAYTRPWPALRPVPLQPGHRGGRRARELRRLDPAGRPVLPPGHPPQPRPVHDPHRRRRVRGAPR